MPDPDIIADVGDEFISTPGVPYSLPWNVESVIVTARYPLGNHQFSASVGYMHGSWEGAENVGRDDSGSVLQGGVQYRYFLSKKTAFYSAFAYMDGRDLFKEIPRYNKYLVTCGLAMKF